MAPVRARAINFSTWYVEITWPVNCSIRSGSFDCSFRASRRRPRERGGRRLRLRRRLRRRGRCGRCGGSRRGLRRHRRPGHGRHATSGLAADVGGHNLRGVRILHEQDGITDAERVAELQRVFEDEDVVDGRPGGAVENTHGEQLGEADFDPAMERRDAGGSFSTRPSASRLRPITSGTFGTTSNVLPTSGPAITTSLAFMRRCIVGRKQAEFEFTRPRATGQQSAQKGNPRYPLAIAPVPKMMSGKFRSTRCLHAFPLPPPFPANRRCNYRRRELCCRARDDAGRRRN